jgi:hypothetical protein
MKPNDTFKYIRADEVAECWEGVSEDLYFALWRIVPHQKSIPNLEDSGPHDHVGHENLAAHWHRLTEEEQAELNKLAEARNKEWNEDWDQPPM